MDVSRVSRAGAIMAPGRANRVGQEAVSSAGQALPWFHRASPFSSSHLRIVGTLRCIDKGRCAPFCKGPRRRDAADPDGREQSGRHDREPDGPARRRMIFSCGASTRTLRVTDEQASPPIPLCSRPRAGNGKVRGAAS